MYPDTIVIVGVGATRAAQMCLPDNDRMIQTSSSNRSDRSFDIGVLPGRAWCLRSIPDARGPDASPADLSVDAIAIANKVFGRRVPRNGLEDLAGGPLRGRIGGDSDMNRLAPFMAYDEQPEKQFARRRWDNEGIDRSNALGVVSEERPPREVVPENRTAVLGGILPL